VGVPVAQRAGDSARLTGGLVRLTATTELASGQVVYVMAVYWPLIGGFIAFVLIAVLIGRAMDPAHRGDADRDRH
jgi:hypothetical protein